MTKKDKKNIARVCGKDFGFYDIPPAMRKDDIEIQELMIPICQGRDSYTVAAEGNAERLAK
jgi:hypothetical protein